jgi:hypothetical protein
MFVEINGELWDEETGEYAGPVSGWIQGDDTPEDVALLVMRKRLDIESQIMAEQAKLNAITANIHKVIKGHESRIAWLERQHGQDLRSFAESQLPRKADGTFKVKTWTCPFGSVSFRSTAAKIAVDSKDVAINWLRTNAPGAIKIEESILISQLPDGVKTQMFDRPDQAKRAGFVIVPANETVTIKTI